jgi:hypothetical protein
VALWMRRIGRQWLAIDWTASYPPVVIYWEPTPHVPAVPGCDEHCPKIWQAWLFHYIYLQPKLARDSRLIDA